MILYTCLSLKNKTLNLIMYWWTHLNRAKVLRLKYFRENFKIENHLLHVYLKTALSGLLGTLFYE